MKLQLSRNMILVIDGEVTGKHYVFNGVGSIVDVDDKDGEIMKIKTSGQPCCSGGEPSLYFYVVEEAKKSTSTRSK
jgi:hypothetical protein